MVINKLKKRWQQKINNENFPQTAAKEKKIERKD